MKKIDVFFIVIGLVIVGVTYSVVKNKNKKKSFLKMTEAEKKASMEEETAKRLAIQNNEKLTQQQKIEAEEAMNRQILANTTAEEAKAIAEYNIKNIMNGTTQIKDAGLPFYLTGNLTAGNVALRLSPSDLGVPLNLKF